MSQAFDLLSKQKENKSLSHNERNAVLSRECYLRFYCGDSLLFCPFLLVKEVTEWTEIVSYPFEMGRHLGIVNIRGNIIPVISLAHFLGDQQTNCSASGANLKIVVLTFSDNSLVAFIATRVKKIYLNAPDISNRIVNIESVPARFFDESDIVEYLEAEHES